MVWWSCLCCVFVWLGFVWLVVWGCDVWWFVICWLILIVVVLMVVFCWFVMCLCGLCLLDCGWVVDRVVYCWGDWVLVWFSWFLCVFVCWMMIFDCWKWMYYIIIIILVNELVLVLWKLLKVLCGKCFSIGKVFVYNVVWDRDLFEVVCRGIVWWVDLLCFWRVGVD